MGARLSCGRSPSGSIVGRRSTGRPAVELFPCSKAQLGLTVVLDFLISAVDTPLARARAQYRVMAAAGRGRCSRSGGRHGAASAAEMGGVMPPARTSAKHIQLTSHRMPQQPLCFPAPSSQSPLATHAG